MRYAQITYPGTSPYIIADDGLGRGPGSKLLVAGWPGAEQRVQELPYLNGGFQQNLPQANKSTRFSLLVEYEFNTEAECFMFTCHFSRTITWSGMLEMGVRGPGGGKVVFLGSVVERVTPAVGVSDPQVIAMRLRWDILAGMPTNPK